MKIKFYLLLLSLSFCLVANAQETTKQRDLYSDTWVATDALGRTMPLINLAGPVKTDHKRVVGIFYITWHSDNLANMKKPYSADVTKVLLADSNARIDAK